ncbi:MAG: hypothetical protein H6867_10185 [Rhodospirillales bacterium]|nr:hypothetical protein [Rhodospirillales bacterium]MCB9995848.1 hypothetical protein [Rhodospirillales bacterium]
MARFLAIMVLLVLAAGVLTPAVLQAQDFSLMPKADMQKTAKEESEKFFNDCAKDPIIKLSDTSNMAFCACSAMQIYEWMQKPSEKKDLEFFETTTKELDKNTLLTQIYGPCLYVPAFEMAYLNCAADERYERITTSWDELDMFCRCVAKGDEAYFSDYAQPFLEMKIADGKDIRDPIDTVQRDIAYYTVRRNNEVECNRETKRIYHGME